MNMMQLILMSFVLVKGDTTLSVSLDTFPHDTVTVKINKFMHFSGVKVHRIVGESVALEMVASDGYRIIAPIELIEKNLLLFADSLDHQPLDSAKYGWVFVVPLDERPHYRMFAVKKLDTVRTLTWPFRTMPDTIYAAMENDWLEAIKSLPDTELVLVMACDSMKLTFPAKAFKVYAFKHDTGTVGEFVDFHSTKSRLLNISDPAWLIIGNSKGYVLVDAPKLAMGDTVSVAQLLEILDYTRPSAYEFKIGEKKYSFDDLKSVRLMVINGKAYFAKDGEPIGRIMIVLPHANPQSDF